MKALGFQQVESTSLSKFSFQIVNLDPYTAAEVAPPPEPEPEPPAWAADASDAAKAAVFIALCGAIGMGGPDPATVGMVTTFFLSCIVGYFAVKGVAHALHSPLMSVTNAISGMTALGALEVMRGGIVPDTALAWAAAAAVRRCRLNTSGLTLG